MFESTAPFTLFDYFRVPYELGAAEPIAPGIAALSLRGRSASLFWQTGAAFTKNALRPSSYFVGPMPLLGRIASDSDVRLWLRRLGGRWRSAHEIRDADGTLVGAVWQKEDGSTFLPFDPNELVANFWSERYLDHVRPNAVTQLASLARRGYYRARPLLPRSLQMTMRRSFSRVQSKARFPRWPVETALHDLYEFLFVLVADVAEGPVPYIGSWPRNWAWAMVLTHDVETQKGYERLPKLLRVEVEAGYRSSWNFVPENRYAVDDDLVRTLQEQGFEVGVHGLYHDGRDLSSSKFQDRLPAIRSYAEKWQAKGFRSPGTLRSPTLMPLLGFDYDSSYTDTAPFEPQPGGCCSWLPYMIENLIELPITLPQDHTLFDLLEHRDETFWVEKARFLRHRGGMALVLTHPDYVENPYLLDSYRRLLQEFADDSTAWKALPRDVSDWWRRRSESKLVDFNGEWRVIGPAGADARIEFASPGAVPAGSA
jgi:peptidoglycan/xylan/chitin deacetylase (PgdA/CDA1 family)